MTTSSRTTRSIAEAVAHTVARVREVQAPQDAWWKDQRLKATAEGMEQHLRPDLDRIFAHLKAMPDMPEFLSVILDKATGPSAQYDLVYGLFMIIGSILAIPGTLGPIWLQQPLNQLSRDFPDKPLTPADLALAVVRGHAGFDWAEGQAAFSAMSAGNFQILHDITGEPPGPLQLVESYRRGFIDEGRLIRGIKESRIRDEWVDVMVKLRHAPPSPADAIRAAIRTRLTVDDARHKAELGGMAPEDFDWVLNATGNPPSLQEAFALYHRGHIGAADVQQIIRESNVMNRYVATLSQLQEPIPGLLYIRLLVGAGAVPDQQAIDWILKLGYSQQVAAGIVSAAHKGKTSKHKDLSESLIVKVYEDRAVDRATAATMLTGLGYDVSEAGMILDLADHTAQAKRDDAVISHVRTRYLAHHIDESEASGEMQAAGVVANQISALVNLWRIERRADVRVLTPAQLLKANKTNVLDDLTTRQRLLDLGYTQADADLLITIDGSGGAGLI